MPIYEWICPKGHEFELTMSVAQYSSRETCKCGAEARRVISLPRLVTASADVAYDSPIDGRPITSRAQRLDDLARHGCREYDPEMKKDAARFRARLDESLDKSVDEHIERQFETMPQRKREQLENEVKAGADVNVIRSAPK